MRSSCENKAKQKRDCRTWTKLVEETEEKWQQWRWRMNTSSLMGMMRKGSKNGHQDQGSWGQEKMGQGIDWGPKNRSKKYSGRRQEVSCDEWLGLSPLGDVMYWQGIFLCASSPGLQGEQRCKKGMERTMPEIWRCFGEWSDCINNWV